MIINQPVEGTLRFISVLAQDDMRKFLDSGRGSRPAWSWSYSWTSGLSLNPKRTSFQTFVSRPALSQKRCPASTDHAPPLQVPDRPSCSSERCGWVEAGLGGASTFPVLTEMRGKEEEWRWTGSQQEVLLSTGCGRWGKPRPHLRTRPLF